MTDTKKTDQSSKDDVYFKICNAVLKLEVSKGHLKWTVSDVARESDITRSLIYYYFGKEKISILEEAYRFMTDTIFNLSGSESVGIKKRMQITLKKMAQMPYLFVLFYLEKGKDTEMGSIIKKAEEKLLLSFKQDYSELSDNEVLKIYLLELGSIAFKLSPEKAEEIFLPFDKVRDN